MQLLSGLFRVALDDGDALSAFEGANHVAELLDSSLDLGKFGRVGDLGASLLAGEVHHRGRDAFLLVQDTLDAEGARGACHALDIEDDAFSHVA